jgi:hypothetical protein
MKPGAETVPCPRAVRLGLRCGAAEPVPGEPCPACAAPLPPMCPGGHGPMIEIRAGLHECATCSTKAVNAAPQVQEMTG